MSVFSSKDKILAIKAMRDLNMGYTKCFQVGDGSGDIERRPLPLKECHDFILKLINDVEANRQVEIDRLKVELAESKDKAQRQYDFNIEQIAKQDVESMKQFTVTEKVRVIKALRELTEAYTKYDEDSEGNRYRRCLSLKECFDFVQSIGQVETVEQHRPLDHVAITKKLEQLHWRLNYLQGQVTDQDEAQKLIRERLDKVEHRAMMELLTR